MLQRGLSDLKEIHLTLKTPDSSLDCEGNIQTQMDWACWANAQHNLRGASLQQTQGPPLLVFLLII